MNGVNTVRGLISPEELGSTLMHEHILFGYPGFSGDVTCGYWDEQKTLHNCCSKLFDLRKCGVNSIVDVTPNECGRNPSFYKKLSEITGINIICATGYYSECSGAPAYFKMRSLNHNVEEEIFEMMMTELTDGIGKTGIKPGVIKVASSKNEITQYEELFFRAAARAHRETKVPIMTHTEEGMQAMEQINLLKELGVDLCCVVIGHSCGNLDVETHMQICNTGAFVGFDRFGVQNMLGVHDIELRIKTLAELIKRGCGKSVILSHDYVMVELGRGSWNDDHNLKKHMTIFNMVKPKLIEKGVKEEMVDSILIGNPQCLFQNSIDYNV